MNETAETIAEEGIAMMNETVTAVVDEMLTEEDEESLLSTANRLRSWLKARKSTMEK